MHRVGAHEDVLPREDLSYVSNTPSNHALQVLKHHDSVARGSDTPAGHPLKTSGATKAQQLKQSRRK